MVEKIVVPQAVAHEIQHRGSQDITVQTLDRTDWLEVTETPAVPSLIQAWGLAMLITLSLTSCTTPAPAPKAAPPPEPTFGVTAEEIPVKEITKEAAR